MKHCILLLLTLILLNVSSEAGRILVLQPFGSKSHKNVFVPLIRELAERGHRLTYVGSYPTTEFANNPNIEEIIIHNLALDPSKYGNVFDTYRDKSVKLEMAKTIFDFPPFIANETYSHPGYRRLLNEKFDLTFVSSSFSVVSYPLIWHLKTPFIIVSPNVLFPGLATVMGDTEHTEYVPSLFSSFSDRMSLTERIVNLGIVSVFDYIFNVHPRSVVLETVKDLIPNTPPLEQIEANVSLVFTNSHPVFNYPRVLPPDVIEVGAMHCRPAKPLPQDLEEWISAEPSGFVVFAVGSAIPMTDMPPELINTFINVFSKLPQRVIWQWKGNKPEVSDNILLLDWLPQQDLLGHDNCKAFITHGGLMSIQEAVYHGVPLLGLPFGTDQHLNMRRAQHEGYAITLEWLSMDEESLTTALNQLTGNLTYSRNARRLQGLLRDQPETPLERAVFWTEHVLRHQGTQHLRLASRDLHILQRLGLDVFLVLLAIELFIIFVFCYCVKYLCCKKRQQVINELQKKKNN